MTTKVNGAAYAGIWVEKQVAFVKMTFDQDIRAIPATDLVVLGTATPAGLGTVADSEFGVVESVIVQALKTVAATATILAVSRSSNGLTYDVMLGYAEGWFSDVNGLITAAPLAITGAQAVVTTAGAAPTNVLGALVGVVDGAVTVSLSFSYMNGAMAAATLANGGLTLGPGSTSGATPTNSPTGTAGYYPANLNT